MDRPPRPSWPRARPHPAPRRPRRSSVCRPPSARCRRAEQRQPLQAQRPAETERPRFGINSLINRMTHPHGDSAQAQARRQPQVSSYPEEEAADPEQERIEIPAFLRRQAN